jgi:hypothetical protein
MYIVTEESATWLFFENYGDSKGRCGVVAIFQQKIAKKSL